MESFHCSMLLPRGIMSSANKILSTVKFQNICNVRHRVLVFWSWRYLNCDHVNVLQYSQSIGISKGAPVTLSPLGPVSFISMQFSAKILLNDRFLPQTQGLVPPFWDILDPPLQSTRVRFNFVLMYLLSK